MLRRIFAFNEAKNNLIAQQKVVSDVMSARLADKFHLGETVMDTEHISYLLRWNLLKIIPLLRDALLDVHFALSLICGEDALCFEFEHTKHMAEVI